MKTVPLLMSKFSKSKAARLKTWFAAYMLLLFVSTVVFAPVVLAQTNLDVNAEFEFDVTSPTTLMEPGTHSFEVTGNGNIFAPFENTFTMNGSGTATYYMVGGGSPPGEFHFTLEMSGYIEESVVNGPSVITGPYDMTVIAHATRAQVATTPGYVRTEELTNVAINGTFNESPWNATSTSTIVDFSVIEETAIQIRLTGFSHVVPEFSSIVILSTVIIATFVVIVYRKRRYV